MNRFAKRTHALTAAIVLFFILGFALLSSIPRTHALDQNASATMSNAASAPSSPATKATVENIRAKFSQVTSAHTQVMLVQGSGTSLFERSYLAAIRSQYPDTAKYPLVQDSAYPAKGPLDTTVILIGGPAQNSVSSMVLSSPAASQGTETYDAGVGKIIFISGATTSYIILSDYRGFGDLRNSAASKSPLAHVIPPAYVPAAASLIGLLLLWLWRLFATIGEAAGEGHFARKALERSKNKHLERIKGSHQGTVIAGIRVKAREWIAIIATGIIFALSVSYVYLQSQSDVLQFVLINILVNLAIQAIWHIVRLLYDRHYKTHTEYALWIWGALLTLLTGWLGNTFAIAGFTVSVADKEEKKREGHSTFIVCLIVFALSAIAFILNAGLHSEIIQMAGIVGITLVLLELLPFSPFSGPSVRAWSRKAWWWLFVPVALIYLAEVII